MRTPLPRWCLIAVLCTAVFGQDTKGARTANSEPQISTARAENTRSIRSQVIPEYPDIAAKMKLVGTVQVQAIVSPDGTVKEVRVIGGHPVLVETVVRAVLKWRFEPGSKETKESVKISFGR
ncbi:MAG TPA: energy transducer TonB [Terriglobales bacterium]|nr:energy transducer TonB [Terriglobales bacterium]